MRFSHPHPPLPGGATEVTFQGKNGNLMKSPWAFAPAGRSGKLISSLLPQLARHVDDMAFVHSMTSRSNTYGPGCILPKTGSTLAGLGPMVIYPSLPAPPEVFPMSSAEQARWFSKHVQPQEPALPAYLSKRFPTLPDHHDLVQETCARLLRVDDPGRLVPPKAFLFTTARNAAIDLFRRRNVQPHESFSDTEGLIELPLPEAPPTMVETIGRRQRRETLTEARGLVVSRKQAVEKKPSLREAGSVSDPHPRSKNQDPIHAIPHPPRRRRRLARRLDCHRSADCRPCSERKCRRPQSLPGQHLTRLRLCRLQHARRHALEF